MDSLNIEELNQCLICTHCLVMWWQGLNNENRSCWICNKKSITHYWEYKIHIRTIASKIDIQNMLNHYRRRSVFNEEIMS